MLTTTEITSMQDEIAKTMCNRLANKLDEIILDGLAKKGYVFANDAELHEFVKENCSAIDYQERQEKIYSVKGVPFLLHSYKMEISPIIELERSTELTANWGSFAYL